MPSGAAAAIARTAIGDGLIVTGDGNVSIHGDLVRSDVPLQKDSHVISGEQAFERIGAAVRLNLKQLEGNIEQARLESNQFFRLTLIFAVLGFIVVIAGVALLLLSQVTGGVVTTVSSVIPETTALLFFNKDRELRKTIESYHQFMLESQHVHTMIDVAETISNPVERDRMKQEIILKVLSS
jgi:hypothetical protein